MVLLVCVGSGEGEYLDCQEHGVNCLEQAFWNSSQQGIVKASFELAIIPTLVQNMTSVSDGFVRPLKIGDKCKVQSHPWVHACLSHGQSQILQVLPV